MVEPNWESSSQARKINFWPELEQSTLLNRARYPAVFRTGPESVFPAEKLCWPYFLRLVSNSLKIRRYSSTQEEVFRKEWSSAG